MEPEQERLSKLYSGSGIHSLPELNPKILFQHIFQRTAVILFLNFFCRDNISCSNLFSIQSYLDHRIAMAFSIAGLAADGETQIIDSQCVDVSYPEFYATLNLIGI